MKKCRQQFIAEINRRLSIVQCNTTGVKSIDCDLNSPITIGDKVQNTWTFRYGKVSKIENDYAIVQGMGKTNLSQLRKV